MTRGFRRRNLIRFAAVLVVCVVAGIAPARAEPPPLPPPPSLDRDALEFFETRVRPLLVERCHECHGPDQSRGNLRLDRRDGLLQGGDYGPAVVPGDLEESLLIEAVSYEDEFLRMPPKGKLSDEEIATLTRWVAMGAPWPAEGEDGPGVSGEVFDLERRATELWSVQPLSDLPPPEVADTSWPINPIDRFILADLEALGLTPAPEADRRTLIRRLSFDLTGLPPCAEEVEAFVHDPDPNAYETLVERLLASPHYGERWARHWLDLVRFAETAGHEFDYDLRGAWRYRDYVIRAFNDDLPYDQFLIEHIAGDRLDPPRRHPVEGFNESVLATGFFFLGEGTHSPVDVREEQVTRVENQIDVLSKAFLGLTVACARCHDHKFDPISTQDYYALAGFLKSSRHRQAIIDHPERIGTPVAKLEAIQAEIASRLAESGGLPDDFELGGEDQAEGDESIVFEDFSGSTYDGWFVTGDAFGSGPSRRGDFRLESTDSGPVAVFVAPGQAHSGLVSDRLQGALRSQSFTIEHDFIHYFAHGSGGRINLVVDGFEKIRSPIYGGLTLAIATESSAEDSGPRWFTQDVGLWRGHTAYIEIADGASVDFTGAQSRPVPGDGFLAVAEIRVSDSASPPTAAQPPITIAVPLDSPELVELATRSFEVEARIPEPTLALAIADGTAVDDHVHIRGSHRNLGETVPRRFLEALGGAPVASEGSGRLELARAIADPTNPLTARVMINRLWAWHFGQGLVATPDDFGTMGQPPTHPELLDWLARRFLDEGWSIKQMHRLMVGSRTYRMRSTASLEAQRIDPANRLWHRMHVRRLEAEAIRDAMLAVSGRLDRTLFGPSVPPFLTPFLEGRGRPASSGPLDGDGRRSVYLNVRRNFLSPMLLAFDFPAPASTMGRRTVSNVPAQALTLLNDPFVIAQARLWAERVLAEPGWSAHERLDALYRAAFGRQPSDAERAQALAFLDAARGGDPSRERDAWADLCHVLLNTKEFLFVP